jgi:hypothetical protein
MKVIIGAAKDLTQRKALEKLIPNLFVMRKLNFSWDQITELLNGKCGFKLRTGTVRTYFSEMAKKQEYLCQAAMKKHLSEAAKIKEDE